MSLKGGRKNGTRRGLGKARGRIYVGGKGETVAGEDRGTGLVYKFNKTEECSGRIRMTGGKGKRWTRGRLPKLTKEERVRIGRKVKGRGKLQKTDAGERKLRLEGN